MATPPATGQTDKRAAAAPASQTGSKMTGAARAVGRWAALAVTTVARTAGRAARAARPKRRIRFLDVLRALGLAGRAVPRAVVGPKAYVQWWQRILALIVLVLLVIGIGFVFAAAVGLMVVVAGFLLEQAIA